jgi:hypothetical protein
VGLPSCACVLSQKFVFQSELVKMSVESEGGGTVIVPVSSVSSKVVVRAVLSGSGPMMTGRNPQEVEVDELGTVSGSKLVDAAPIC